MRRLFSLSIAVLLVQQIVAPPVTKTHEEEKSGNDAEKKPDEMNFEYERYLKEVIEALESDTVFRAKLEKAEEGDIRSGRIARELEHVSHHVRSKLDEVKRAELERLKRLIAQKKAHELDPRMAEHLDHENGHTFEIKDLEKLIKKTNDDLSEADKKRREDFKEYEMQKKFEEEQKMKELDEAAKQKYADELKTMKEKHKKHDPLHHPGSQKQLQEVWEEQDHMRDQEFNPKTFFYTHDLDGNGYWDQDEVKALFIKELDKMYSENPEDDRREREEEMERMREHVFTEADTNHDGVIDYPEFLAQTQKTEFQNDPGWKPLDEQEIYSQQEYEAFEKQREQEIQKMIAQGLIPPHPDYGHPGQFPPQHVDPNQIHHPGQVPVHQQGYQGQVPAQHQQQYQVPHGQQPVQHQQYQGQPIQQQQHQYQGQPIQQQYQGQPIQQQYQGQPIQHQAQHQQQQQQHQQQQQQQQQQHQQQQQQQQQQQHQNLNNEIPPSVQVQPNIPPVISNQPIQGAPVVNQQHQQPVQNIPNQPQAQAINGANVVSPNVVHA